MLKNRKIVRDFLRKNITFILSCRRMFQKRKQWLLILASLSTIRLVEVIYIAMQQLRRVIILFFILFLIGSVFSPYAIAATETPGGTDGSTNIINNSTTRTSQISKKRYFPSQEDVEQAYQRCKEDNTMSMECWSRFSLSHKLAAITASSIGEGGAVQSVGHAMAYVISHPPASSGVYIADLLKNSPVIPQAYAQGIGFSSLSPVLPIWKVFRDLSYSFFAMIFVVIGFMIMFRQKISGQAQATITSVLPNLVVTLIIITFSYAIAGLLIDLMYLVIYFIVGVFGNIINEPK